MIISLGSDQIVFVIKFIIKLVYGFMEGNKTQKIAAKTLKNFNGKIKGRCRRGWDQPWICERSLGNNFFKKRKHGSEWTRKYWWAS